jgi:ATP adenylyltransferase
MLNRYPSKIGQLMIFPRRLVAGLELLTREERATIDDLIVFALAQLREVMRPAGFNVGINLGRVAGAGIADHMHWHIVPRWDGDSNFMPAIATTRVISQHLEQSYDLLAPRFKAMETAIS